MCGGCRVCSVGLYSCHWRRQSERKHSCFWFSVVAVVSLLSLCWMYICLVAYNDHDEVNWHGFTQLKRWVNWFMVLIIISAVLTSYCILLLLFALVQVALQEPLHLHCLHRFFLVLGVIFIAVAVTGFTLQWRQEWPTVPLSLLATGPFLQFGAVGALTLLSPFIFKAIHSTRKTWSKILITVVFVAVSGAIFLCPLFIKSPCLMELSDLPEKPKFIGHRGAPMVAPENTMMSFNRSMGCGVMAFETDVQLSKDRKPFLMHDDKGEFLRRTTNVKEKFPTDNRKSSNWTWGELQSLNAGEWFLKTDPFRSASKLTEEEKERARDQKIPSLQQLLNLAKENNISVLFDLYSPDEDNDTEVVVDTIFKSGIDPSLILWLPPAKRQYVKETAPGFIQVYNGSERLKDNKGNFLNVKYNSLTMEEIREHRAAGVSVNVWVVDESWLFSLLWCAGVSSVTTNACHLLQHLEHPNWTMRPGMYRFLWIFVNIASFLIMAGIYVIQRRAHCFHHDAGNSPDSSRRVFFIENGEHHCLHYRNVLQHDQE